MNELQKIKNDLKEIRKSIIKLSYIYLEIPQVQTYDCEELLDEIKYLCGYVDCMINFEIDLVDVDKTT